MIKKYIYNNYDSVLSNMNFQKYNKIISMILLYFNIETTTEEYVLPGEIKIENFCWWLTISSLKKNCEPQTVK